MSADPPSLGTYGMFSPCIVGIVSIDDSGTEQVGAATHIGAGVLVTARHVVEGRTVTAIIGKANVSVASLRTIYPADPNIDLALLLSDFDLDHYMNRTRIMSSEGEITDKIDHVYIGGHLDDWIDDGLILLPVTVFGFPPIPTASGPHLVAARGEINAIIDPYIGSPHPLFIVSPLARGGFSGGPVLLGDSYLLGVITTALVQNHSAPELGFHAAITVEPIWNLLFENRIFPGRNAELMYELRYAFNLSDEDFPPEITRPE